MNDPIIAVEDQKVLALIDGVLAGEQYGYDRALLTALVACEALDPVAPTFFSFEAASNQDDKSKVRAQVSEKASGAAGRLDAKLDAGQAKAKVAFEDLDKHLESLPKDHKTKVPVSTLMAVLGAIHGTIASVSALSKIDELTKPAEAAATGDAAKTAETAGHAAAAVDPAKKKALVDKLLKIKTMREEAIAKAMKESGGASNGNIESLRNELKVTEKKLSEATATVKEMAKKGRFLTKGRLAYIGMIMILYSAAWWVISKVVLSGLHWIKSHV